MLLMAVCTLAYSAVVWAQVTATISGRIEDPTGAAVAGALVTVKSVETGATRTATTDDMGSFRVVALPIGPHEVRAEKMGFKVAVRTGINLVVGQEAVVNLKLDVGAVAQEVNVSLDVPLIDTTTASVSGIVDERQIKELPLNGRSFDSLVTLNPGAVNYVLKSPGTVTSNGNTFAVSGRRPLDNIVLLNGVEYTGSSQLAITPGGVSGDLLGIDAVREFNVMTGAYPAEFGKRAGAQVNVVTQSGTNKFHGSVFEFLRNSALDARNPFDQGNVAPFRRNQFGGSIGGPIKTDRAFFFGNYEGFRHRLGVSNVAVVPDAFMRLGQLPNAATGIYAPVAGLKQSQLAYMSFWPQPDAGSELLDPVSGLPTGTAFSHNTPKQSIDEDFATFKGDYRMRDRDAISISYTIDDGVNTSPLADPLFANYSKLRAHVASIREVHVFSPRILNTLTVGFSRASFGLDAVNPANIDPSLDFVAGAGPGGIVIGGSATTTGLAAITSAGPNNAAGVRNHRNLYTLSDDVQFSSGRHQFSAGVWFQRLHDNEDSASVRSGQATFASLTSFLQGTVQANGFQVAPNTTELGWRSFFGAWYVQDSIRLRRNLNLRVGLRHEFTTGWNEEHDRAANYIYDANHALVTDPVKGSSAYTTNNGTALFGPRVALAWDPFGDSKTSIRAGYGLYYSLIDNLAFLLNALPPYNSTITFSGAMSSFPIALPIQPGVQLPPSCSTGGPTPCSIFAPRGIEPGAKTPAVNEWNLTIERQISPSMAVRVGYVGSFGYHGLLSIDPNSVAPAICAADTCTAGGNAGVTNAALRSTVARGDLYVPVQTRPNPNLSAGFFWNTEGNSRYNALQLEVSRRLSRGLQFRGNYTWSKNMDMNSGLTGAQAQNQAQMVWDRNKLRRDWGSSALTPTSQASISAHYDLPFTMGQGTLHRVIGGWQLNQITTLLSGFPLTPQIGSNRSGDGDTRNPDRPNLDPTFTGHMILGTAARWFDPKAFTLPAVGTFGTLGRGTLRGPGLSTVDISAIKNIAVTERVNLQFRTEFFNAFNHTNLGNPNLIVFAGTAPNLGYNASAGLITTTATDSRRLQFALKMMF
jgi:hypothetical protein